MLALVLQLWTSLTTPQERFDGVRLHGVWQSCMENDGTYAERVFPYVKDRTVQWSLHMGPLDEFGLYRGWGPDGLHTHETNDDQQFVNLLGTAFRYWAFDTKTGRNWAVPSLKLKINVITGGEGPDPSCQSFYVKVEETNNGLYR